MSGAAMSSHQSWTVLQFLERWLKNTSKPNVTPKNTMSATKRSPQTKTLPSCSGQNILSKLPADRPSARPYVKALGKRFAATAKAVFSPPSHAIASYIRPLKPGRAGGRLINRSPARPPRKAGIVPKDREKASPDYRRASPAAARLRLPARERPAVSFR